MEYRELAGIKKNISRVGFGCWAIGGHGYGVVNDRDSKKAIETALNGGINFFDTADVYGFGKSEAILCNALGRYRKEVVIATKGGVRWDDSGKTWKDCSPSYLRKAVERSLKRLGLECIPLYYIHWPDGKTPIVDAVGELSRLRGEGKIGSVGVSNFSAVQLEEAKCHEDIQAVQLQYNIFQKAKAEDLIPICQKKNIALVAWGVLGDGLLTGKYKADAVFESDDHRSRSPEFKGQNFLDNLIRVEELKTISLSKGVSTSQLALRWVLDSIDLSYALFGAKTEAQVFENLGCLGWRLTVNDLAEIERIFG